MIFKKFLQKGKYDGTLKNIIKYIAKIREKFIHISHYLISGTQIHHYKTEATLTTLLLPSGEKREMELESAPEGLILVVKEPGNSTLIVGK